MQSSLRQSTQEKINSQLREIQDLQDRLQARDDELSWLLTDQTKLTRGLVQSRLQSATPTVQPSTPVEDGGNFARPANRANFIRSGEVAAVYASTAVYVRLLAERDKHKNRFEELSLNNKCNPG